MRLVAASAAALVFSGASQFRSTAAPRQSYTIVHAYPHDPSAFTQGLEYHDGFLYEGTGLNGRSSIRKVKLETGEVVQRRDVPSRYFGEGITIWKAELFELTWRSQLAFTYDLATFAPKRTLSYAGEGWGLTHDDRWLILSYDAGHDRLFVTGKLWPKVFEIKVR